jgi:hypothetical protein
MRPQATASETMEKRRKDGESFEDFGMTNLP